VKSVKFRDFYEQQGILEQWIFGKEEA